MRVSESCAAFVVLTVASCGRAAVRETESPVGNVLAGILPSPDGDVVDLTRFRGRPLVIHVALTGSLDSQSDVEELRRARTARRGLALAELVFDDDAAKLAVPWANASGIDWVVLLPTPEVRQGDSPLGKIRVIPTTFIVSRDGRVAWRWEGALPRGSVERAVQELE